MTERMQSDCRMVCTDWSQALTNTLHHQWWLLDVSYQAGLKLLEALMPPRDRPNCAETPPGRVDPKGETRPRTRRHELEDLVDRALDCVRRGVALPHEVYDVRNRHRIDWSKFPEWARPIDPDEFTGSVHEG